MVSSITASKKFLIVDDEVALDELERKIFLNTFSLPSEYCIFVHDYEEAIEKIKLCKELAFCFLDYRIPKNATSPEEQNVNDPNFVEWGIRLIPQINFPILIYSGIVPVKFLEKEAIKYSHIVGLFEKPFNEQIIPFSDRIASIDRTIKPYLEKILKLDLSDSTEIEVNSFNYASLDEETSKFVLERTREIKKLAKRAVEDIINIGLYLIEIKDKLGHGNFYNWLNVEFNEISKGHAATLMRTAVRFKSTNFSDLNILPSALYELSANNVSDEAVEEVLIRARKGEKISYATAKAVKVRYQNDNRKTSEEENKTDNSQKEPENDGDRVVTQQLKEVKTTEDRSAKINPPPLLLNSEQQASLKKSSSQFKNQPQIEILKVRQNIVKNSFWQLGKNHHLFCGEPKNPIFLHQLPGDLALSIGLPPNNNPDLIPAIKAKAKYIFSYDYDDMDLSGIEEMLTIAIDLSVGENNKIVFCYLSHLRALQLAVDMLCRCYVAEPDLNKCEAIIELWRKKASVKRLKLN